MVVAQQSQPRGHQVQLLLTAALKTAPLDFTKDQSITSYLTLSNCKHGKKIEYSIGVSCIFLSIK